MRIIAGKFKGRKISFPKSKDIRPTQDKMRESLFNVIAPVIANSKILDLFAGSGAIGIEGISRGAKEATFIDSNFFCIKTIKKNLSDLEISSNVHVLKMNVSRAIEKFFKEGVKFDIVFLDPPYYKDLAKKTLIKLKAYDILSPNAVVVTESYKKDSLDDNIDNILSLYKRKILADTVLSFYRKNE